ncbi:DUF3501 family protein [Caulobacter mirabilis]|uniref:DUF3501 domain-containing protein n=1 Tax=Caulobacter mirabilis TaxID=69666 RepID=A0A2D2B220_9CAUL|nr:DUF3501 family protein [Caulobacter mirabilis]ATQ44268.1 hypothetical protein CSW64_18680 [Caulobacter mirabilis]
MPAPLHRIMPEDLLPAAVYAVQRRSRRATLLPMKRLRRVDLGPACAIGFESYDTVLLQVQETLLAEAGEGDGVATALAAYNPLIPQGAELIATAMFGIDDDVRRAAILARLAGARDCFFLQVGGDRVRARPRDEIDGPPREREEAAVHFLRFRLSDAQKAVFRDPATVIAVGCDHEAYAHVAMLSPAARAELAHDLAWDAA